MTARIGINGFGRMGRLGFRAAFDWPELEIVHVNDPAADAGTAAHLLEFDSVHGRWPRAIEAAVEGFLVDGRRVTLGREAAPSGIPWREFGVDVVVESSGRFRTPETLGLHLANGARKVVVAAPVKDPSVLNIVMGCNDERYDPAVHDVVTAASCTTNCIAPVIRVVHEAFGIERGAITTLHDVTNTQVIVDAPHHDLRRARSALNSLIPTTTGSATAIGLIYPELQGRLDGLAVRVPLLNSSLTDCVFEVARPVTVEEVNEALRAAAEGPLAGILGFEERPLVSADFVNDSRSGIVDGPCTRVIDGRLVKVFVWYDNEWGYANRMMELVRRVAASLGRPEGTVPPPQDPSHPAPRTS